MVEKVVEVPQIRTRYVYRDVPVPKYQSRKVLFERKIRQFYGHQNVEIQDLPVPKLWERFTYKPFARPRYCAVPVPKLIEK